MADKQNTKKKSLGSMRAKAGMSAKAGRRQSPPKPGKHRTTPEDRARGAMLAAFGLRNYPKPQGWMSDEEAKLARRRAG